MPTFKFTSPEGKVYKVDGPEGATKEQAWTTLQQHLGNIPAPAAEEAPSKPLTEKVGNFVRNVIANPPPTAAALISAVKAPGDALQGKADFTTDEGITQNIPRSLGMSAFGLGVARVPNVSGALPPVLTKAPAEKLMQDAAQTAQATGTAPEAAAASSALHGPAVDAAMEFLPAWLRAGIKFARQAQPKAEAPPAPPAPPGYTPPTAGPWGPFGGSQRPTGPIMAPVRPPSALALPPPSGGPIAAGAPAPMLALPAPTPGPASPFPGPAGQAPMPMPGSSPLALPSPDKFPIPMGQGPQPLALPAPPTRLTAPDAAAAPVQPVTVAKAITKANGKVSVTPAADDPFAIPDFLQRGSKAEAPKAPAAPPAAEESAANTVFSQDKARSMDLLPHTAAGLDPAEAAAHIADNYIKGGASVKSRPSFISTVERVLTQKALLASNLERATGIPADTLTQHLWALRDRGGAKAWRDQLLSFEPDSAKKVQNLFSDKVIEKIWRK